MSAVSDLPRLLLVTDRRRVRGREMLRTILAAVRGGVGAVQVRERDLPDEEIERFLRELRATLPPETLLLVNARPDLARDLGIGLHLPAGAPAPQGEGARPLGRSAHDEAELALAVAEGVDYLIVGTVFPTASKPGHPGDGIEHLRHLARLALPVPVYAIGGITVSHVPEVIHAGAHGIAVCGAILEASDPTRAAEAFRLALSVAAGKRARPAGSGSSRLPGVP